MQNLIMLIGRMVSDPQINETENGKVTTITLAVNRSYKNKDGLYDTDFIPVTLFGNIALSTVEYCRKCDLVGVKGRIEKLGKEEITLVADKVSFLSSKKED